jgi:hypothetical protein
MTTQATAKEARVRGWQRRGATVWTIGLLAAASAALLAGCRSNQPQPPPRVPVPAQGNTDTARRADPVKPLPAPPPQYSAIDMLPGYDDVPLVNQRPPEQRGFVEAYHRVGRPRITVFVNRTLDGQIVPVDPGGTRVGRDPGDVFARTERGTDNRSRDDVYLEPGQYDEVEARAMDYETMETILTDWLAANGQVTIISPDMARQRLTDEQVRDLQSGQPQVLRDVAKQLGTDVLVQVQARPTRQTVDGLEVRLIAEAFNTDGGDSIGRAVVDVPPPLEKRTLNKYTRYIARKLMDDMTYAWAGGAAFAPDDRGAAEAPQGATQPPVAPQPPDVAPREQPPQEPTPPPTTTRP